MKFVKLTNNAERRKGDPVYININHIVSVFEEPTNGGSLATVVFGGIGNGTRWVVEEGPGEVIKKIREVVNESP